MDLETLAQKVSWDTIAPSAHDVIKEPFQLGKELRIVSLYIFFALLALLAYIMYSNGLYDIFAGIVLLAIASYWLLKKYRKRVRRKKTASFEKVPELTPSDLKHIELFKEKARAYDVRALQLLMYKKYVRRHGGVCYISNPSTDVLDIHFQICFVLHDLSRVLVFDISSYEKTRFILKEMRDYLRVPVVVDAFFSEEERQELTINNSKTADIDVTPEQNLSFSRFTQVRNLDDVYWQPLDGGIRSGRKINENTEELNFSWSLKMDLFLMLIFLPMFLFSGHSKHIHWQDRLSIYIPICIIVSLINFLITKKIRFNRHCGYFLIGHNYYSLNAMLNGKAIIKERLSDIKKIQIVRCHKKRNEKKLYCQLNIVLRNGMRICIFQDGILNIKEYANTISNYIGASIDVDPRISKEYKSISIDNKPA